MFAVMFASVIALKIFIYLRKMSWRCKNYSDIIHNLSVTIFDFINSNEVCDRNDEYVVEEIVKFIEEKLKMQEYENYVSS